MKKFSLTEPQDYLALAARRKWWILTVALVLSTATSVIALMLPSFYESETLILVQPRDIPEDVVRDFVTADTQQRLIAIQETVLSRTNLLRIINEFKDGFYSIRHLSPPDQVERLRNRISIEITTDRQSRSTVVPYFRIAYQDRDPEMAQKITARLASLFIEYDTRTRETQVFGTAEFLRNELDKVAAELQEAEQELARVKRQYQYELPDQLDANLRTLDRLQEQLKTNLEAHDRYLALKLDLERQLTETPEYLSREVQRQRQAPPPPAVQEYLQKSRQLKELRTRYTDRHPDVVRLESELATLGEVVSEEDLERALRNDVETSETEREVNPVYSQLSSQLNQVEAELKILKESRDWIERQIGLHNDRVQNTPVREREIASIQRRYDDLSDEYNSLKVKLSQAELAQ
ncbi:MAG TPA: Wzz/FepE/Etk N-terminal domain-containing protein, partial [Acidobacteriota bacterium]|nr:Wzz/FepE/Etk N-terminal domain-containing protein [Acidobacteriota bacterium]